MQFKSKPNKHDDEEEEHHGIVYRLFHHHENNPALSLGGRYYDAHEVPDDEDDGKDHSSHCHYEHKEWETAAEKNHNKGGPILSSGFDRDKLNPEHKDLTEQQLLGRMLKKSRRGPNSHHAFSSNHVVVNSERIERTIAPLFRIPHIDEIARKQAQAMADKGDLFFSDADELQEDLLVSQGFHRDHRIGENVSRGKNLKQIHPVMMKNQADRNNIMDRRFTSFGVGTAKSKEDGLVYLCQLFRE